MTADYLVDTTGKPPAGYDPWEPIVFTAETIDAEIDRLAAAPRPADGRRSSMFVHPRATGAGLGLAPGIRVTLSVLLPGERTRPIRHNSTQVDFCIRGGGHTVIDGTGIRFDRYDAWNTPSYRTYWCENDGDEVQARLTYSNAPLLEKMHVHLVDVDPPEAVVVAPDGGTDDDPGAGHRSPFGRISLGDGGAMLMPYEQLIDPPAVDSKALHWPWLEVKRHLDELDALGADYVGRRLYLLYNPLTGRTNGTTPSFFATITIRPPGITDRPHRHTSAAINYFFRGSGRSRVGGKTYTWKAGDLMFTAPGWMVHNHASDDSDAVYELTVQDQPLNIAMESLLWQEDLKREPIVLGSAAGFSTNRAALTR